MIGCRLSRIRSFLALLFVGLLVVPLPAFANAMPSKAHPGDAGLLVPSSTAEVRIEREVLSFDFVEDVDTANVLATYYLDNSAAREIRLNLAFVAPGGRDLTVTLDGVAVPVEETQADLPGGWSATDRVLDPRTGEEYVLDGVVRGAYTRVWAFPIQVAAKAKATLSVAYSAATGYDRDRADYVLRHTVYSLGPAKNWGGFGTLEVSARVPSAYALAASPVLAKRSDDGTVAEYGGSFDGLPADMLRISTVRTPHPFAAWVDPVLYGLPTMAGLLLAVPVGLLAGRIRRRWRAFLVAGTATFAFGCVVLPVAAMYLSAVEPLASASEDMIARNGYWSVLGLIGWLALVVPFVASLLAATLATIVSGRRPAANAGYAGGVARVP